MAADLLQMIALINEHNGGGMGCDFRRGELGIGHDNHPIAPPSKPGCRPIEFHRPGVGWSRNCIGYQPLPIGDINNLHLLKGKDSGCIQKHLVNTDAAHIVEVGGSQRTVVNLGKKQGALHSNKN